MTSRQLLYGAALMAALLSGCRPHTSTPASTPSSAVAPPASVEAAAAPSRLWVKGTMDVPVIMYHDVVPRKEVWFDLTVREFEEQMRDLAEANASVVPLSDVVAHLRDGKPLPPRAIALTFDDGTLGDYEYAFPILQRHNFPATFFVHTDYVGVKSTKDHMTWDQLRELKGTGLIDIQPHTASHPEDLTKMADEDVRAELSKSNSIFETEMGEKARFLAYPSGHGDERVARLVEEAGYEAAWNEVRAWNASPADRYHLPRFAPFRLYEVLEAWRLERRSGPPTTVVRLPDVPSDPVRTEGVLQYVAGAFPLTPPEGSLLMDGTFTPVPDALQHGSIGRPIVVTSASSLLLARYQPWMGVDREALRVLLPGAREAILGRAWFMERGEVLEASGRRVGDTAVLGVLTDGRLFTGRVARRATAASLEKALRRIGASDAVLLGPGRML